MIPFRPSTDTRSHCRHPNVSDVRRISLVRTRNDPRGPALPVRPTSKANDGCRPCQCESEQTFPDQFAGSHAALSEGACLAQPRAINVQRRALHGREHPRAFHPTILCAAEVHRAAWSTQGTREHTGFIRATPLSEGPQSVPSSLFGRPVRSTLKS